MIKRLPVYKTKLLNGEPVNLLLGYCRGFVKQYATHIECSIRPSLMNCRDNAAYAGMPKLEYERFQLALYTPLTDRRTSVPTQVVLLQDAQTTEHLPYFKPI